MIRVYGECSNEVLKSANEKLNIFIEFYYDLIINAADIQEKKAVLYSLFPVLIVDEKTDKCLKAIEDLYNWTNDGFIHTLKPLHEYALYQILAIFEEQYESIEDEEENVYGMTDYFPLVGEDEGTASYTIADTNTFKFYYINCFLDWDFISIEDYINKFEIYGEKAFEDVGLDIKEYEDLIPIDIIENSQKLKDMLEQGIPQSKKLVHLSHQEFFTHIENSLKLFNHSVVNHSTYKLLWNDDGTPRNEKRAQELLLNTIYSYCNSHGIDVSKEPNIGRGPVDFKLSHGKLKVLIEVKRASNSAFWQGLEVQTIQYMVSEDIKHAIFLIIVYYPKEFEKLDEIQSLINKINKEYSVELVAHIVDATNDKPSASKLIGKESINYFKDIGE